MRSKNSTSKKTEMGFMGMKRGSWSEGMAKFYSRGGLINPVKITKRGKEIILELIKEYKKDTSVYFGEDEMGQRHLGYYLDALHWIEYQMTGKKLFRTRLNRRIGYFANSWISDMEWHSLTKEHDYDIAIQWITNKINKSYSPAELTQWKKTSKP